MSGKRRKRQLKARKAYQTIFLRKGEKRWGSRTIAREGHTISEASFVAARRHRPFGDPVESRTLNQPRIEAILKSHFGTPEPPEQYITINKGLRLYYNIQRTHYRFVEIAGDVIKTSIKYSSVSMAMMCVTRIVWVEAQEYKPAIVL